jgi:hypothetical protein
MAAMALVEKDLIKILNYMAAVTVITIFVQSAFLLKTVKDLRTLLFVKANLFKTFLRTCLIYFSIMLPSKRKFKSNILNKLLFLTA